jgi:hypothetical protein
MDKRYIGGPEMYWDTVAQKWVTRAEAEGLNDIEKFMRGFGMGKK